MRLVRGFVDPPAAARGAVVAIGNFDGLHRGHQAIVRTAWQTARRHGAPLGVVTFEPHPRTLFRRGEPPFRLTPPRAKLRLLAALGVDVAIALRFDERFAATPAEGFANDVLGRGLAVRHAVVGYDFAFGHRRRGNPALLARAGSAHGYGVTIVDPQGDGREIFAASRIRDFLVQGRLDEAGAELGRFWEVEGRVRRGEARGRTIGFPTANIDLREALVPALGVYAVRVGAAAGGTTRWHDGVANLGRRPTFGGGGVLLEVHLLDFEGDLYGRRLRVAFVEFLRPEMRFAGIEALRERIAEDRDRARALLAERARAPGWFADDNVPAALDGRGRARGA